jgi:hypothetical protein
MFTDNKGFIILEADKAEEPEIEETEDLEEDPDNLHSDLEDETVDEKQVESSDDETEDEDDSEPGDMPSLDDEEPDTEPKDDEPKPTEGPDDYDLKDFGKHGGPDVPNNQYNEKDVEILNKLISSESDAINDYFDATTNTVDTNLSRLYGDIGREERFHLEQLMYAKSLITGEKYEPKDPEVKKEYEELIGQGMDEDTAIVTTIDKISVSGGPMSDEEFDETKEEIAQQESFILQSQVLLDMMEESTYSALVNEYCSRVENYSEFYTEAVLNVNTQPKSVTEGQSPLGWIISQIKKIVKFFIKLGSLVKEHMRRSRVKRNQIREWLKYNSLSGIFSKGYSFYMYDLKKGFDYQDLMLFAGTAYKTTEFIAAACGYHRQGSPLLIDTNGVRISNIEQGLRAINGMQLLKTKVIINDSNEDYIKSILFGATPNHKVEKFGFNQDDTGNWNVNNEKVSANFYNITERCLTATQQAAEWTEQLAEHLKDLEGKPGLYQTNHDLWMRSIKQLGVVTKGFTKILAAINHDINTMLKIDTAILDATNDFDARQQAAGGAPVDTTGVTMFGSAPKPQQTKKSSKPPKTPPARWN